MVDKETTCGICNWRPRCLQPLASKKAYMFFYGALGIIQGMLFTYLSATLSTLEKRFGIKSKQAAYLMSGNEISQILFLFVMPCLVKIKRRPLWTSVGLYCSAVGCFLMALPHFLSKSDDMYAGLGTSNSSATSSLDPDVLETAGLCGSAYHPNSLEGVCDESGNRKVDWGGLTLVFLGIVLTGIGNCAFYSFGVAYLDDNTSHENSPIMLGITFTFRLLGPTLGFFLGSFCLKTYVNPSIDPGFTEKDPRWIGAWWLGYPIIGLLIFMFSFPLACFPQRLPKEGTDASRKEKEALNSKSDRKNSLTETRNNFKKAMIRLLTNKLFIYNFFSSIFYVFAFMGFGTFMPKYIEYQFRKSGSVSSTYAGSIGTLSKALGLLISGIVISKLKPSARFLTGYNVFLGGIYFTSLILFSFLGCPTSRVYGTMNEEGAINIASQCNMDCGCPVARLQPICSKDGVTNFYSPCQAGCHGKHTYTPSPNSEADEITTIYENCTCVFESWQKENTSLSNEWVVKDHLQNWEFPGTDVIETVTKRIEHIPVTEAVEGWCDVDCDKMFKFFSLCIFILMVLGSTGRIGNVLVALRCVEVQDKSISMAFNVVFMSLLAMLPAPMVYGAIIDNTCILWQEECGETTNCLLYDTVRLRHVLMFTTAAIMSVGLLCDIGVCYEAKNLVIFNVEGDGKSSKESEEENETSKHWIYASNLSIAKDSMFMNSSSNLAATT